MWLIAGLLFISFVLFFLAQIAKTWGVSTVLTCLAFVVWFAAVAFALGNDSLFYAMAALPFVFAALAELIALPVWRRRILLPCFQATRPGRKWGGALVLVFLCGSFVICLRKYGGKPPPGMDVFAGLMTASMIIYWILELAVSVQICANGVFHNGKLQGWEEWASFSWDGRRTEPLALTLVSKSGLFRSFRFLIRPEDRESVQQVLKEHISKPNVGTVDA